MAKFPHAGAGLETGQLTSSATPQSLDPDATAGPTNRILLSASAAGAYFGDLGVATGTGFPIPTLTPLELWQNTPAEIFVVGGGATVYYYLEFPEGEI